MPARGSTIELEQWDNKDNESNPTCPQNPLAEILDKIIPAPTQNEVEPRGNFRSYTPITHGTSPQVGKSPYYQSFSLLGVAW
ncbi:hypothetical protein I304_04261 [Cryptococcus deuterogattii CBS 10090]|nr:hypothetical protein I304_04261 [Cryptococcus deuterogattii CBS 10090]